MTTNYALSCPIFTLACLLIRARYIRMRQSLLLRKEIFCNKIFNDNDVRDESIE